MSAAPVLCLRGAAAGYGERTLWSGLDLDLAPGEFVAVLGANGTGKTTLLRAVLGLEELRAGAATVCGRAPERGNGAIGYVPQEQELAALAPLRVADLVGFGVDGSRWGPARGRRSRRAAVAAALDEVGAAHLADRPVADLSGGEAQRVRIAQALATDPALLLCDEPFLSLDLRRQRAVAELIDRRRREHATAVLFVTHELNPVLPYVDRLLYLVEGAWRVGTVDEVMTSRSLTELYGTPVEVIRAHDQIVVLGATEHTAHGSHPHERTTRGSR